MPAKQPRPRVHAVLATPRTSTTIRHPDLERRLKVIHTVGQSLRLAQDTRAIATIAVRGVADALGCTHCSFFLRKGKLLEPLTCYGSTITRCFNLGEGLVGYAAQHNKSILTRNARTDKRFTPGKTNPIAARSLIVVPVEVDDVVGVLSADQDQPDAFDERDLELVTTFALQTGAAIRSADLLKQERARGDELALIEEAIRLIQNALNGGIDKTLTHIIEGAMRLLGMHSGVIHLVDENRDAVVRSVEVPLDFGHPRPRFSAKKGMTWRIITKGKIIAVSDTASHPEVNPAMLAKGVHALMDVPLQVEGNVIGVLCLNSNTGRAFTDDDKRLVTMLAGHAAVAIRNADLLRQDRARADAWTLVQDINASLSRGVVDVNDILRHIIIGAMRLLGMDSGVIHLLDDNRDSLSSVEVPRDFGHPRPRFGRKQGLTWEIITSRATIAIPDISSDRRVNPAMVEKGVKAIIDLPLILEDEVIGILCLNSSKARGFTHYEQELLTTLASHAAVAIQNARLFRRRAEAIKMGHNPYQIGAPIADRDGFFGRAHILRTVLAGIQRNNFIIHGERRIGKTSLLKQIALSLEANSTAHGYFFLPVYASLQGTEETAVGQDAFFPYVIGKIREAVDKHISAAHGGTGPRRDSVRSVLADWSASASPGQPAHSAGFRHCVLAAVAALASVTSVTEPENVRIVLLLDEMDRFVSYRPQFHDAFRVVLQGDAGLHLRLIMAGVGLQRLTTALLSPWYNNFQEIRLDRLNKGEAKQLIVGTARGYYTFGVDAIDSVLTRSDRKPLEIQRLCFFSVAAMLERVTPLAERALRPATSRITRADVEVGTARVSESKRDEYEDLWRTLSDDQQALVDKALAGDGAMDMPPDGAPGWPTLSRDELDSITVREGSTRRLTYLFRRWRRP